MWSSNAFKTRAELKAQRYVVGGRILLDTGCGTVMLRPVRFKVDNMAVVDHMYSDCYLGPLLMAPNLLRKSWSVCIWMHRSHAMGSAFLI